MKRLAVILIVVLCVTSCMQALATEAPIASELPIVTEPFTLSVWASGTSAVIDIETNKMTHWFEEKTGVHIDWTFVTSEVSTQRNLSIASGEYPDLYLTAFDTASTLLNAQAGIFIPLNDLIENESVWFKKALEDDPALKTNLTAPDGNIYTFYRTDAGVHNICQNKMYIYQPWLDKYTSETGKGMPETTDEFEELLLYIRDNDMNGNGDASDEIPLAGSYSAWGGDPVAFLMNPFQLWSSNYMVAKDNVVSFTANTDGYRDGLRYINKLYSEGLIAEETYVQDATQLKTRYSVTDPKDETVGLFPACYVNMYLDEAIMPSGMTDGTPVPPLEGPTGLRQAEKTGDKQYRLYGAITSACEKPEIAMKWVDFMLGGEGLEVLFYGFEGTLEEGGQFVWSDEPAITGAVPSRTLTFNGYEPNNDWWGAYGTGPVTDSVELRYSETNVVGGYGWAHYRGHLAYEPYYTDIGLPQIAWPADEDMTTELNELKVLINDFVATSTTQFVMGVQDINDDTVWENYKNELNAMGLERYLELNQTYYFGN